MDIVYALLGIGVVVFVVALIVAPLKLYGIHRELCKTNDLLLYQNDLLKWQGELLKQLSVANQTSERTAPSST